MVNNNPPVLPDYMKLIDWAAILTGDYSSEFLPVLEREENWQDWGQIIATTDFFARRGVPSPLHLSDSGKEYLYENWQDWARDLCAVMNAL